MLITEAIKSVMKEQGTTYVTMAKALNKKRGNDVSAVLCKKSGNMNTNMVIQMLDVLGYELVVQKRKPGGRRDDQIVITYNEEE